jgi:type II secretory pathway pseudopilin PulG
MLLEVMLALAIFVMAGTTILSLVGGTMDGMERMRLTRKAADLARSAMAKMEAGIETPQTLNGPVKPWSATGDESEDAGVPDPSGGWELHIDSEPTPFRGLTKLTVRAFKHGAGDTEVASYSLRQLVRLSAKGEDKIGDEDSLSSDATRGAPAAKNGGTP